MSQAQILKLIKRSRRPLSSKDLIRTTKLNRKSILGALNTLRDSGQVRYFIWGDKSEYFYYLEEFQVKNMFAKNSVFFKNLGRRKVNNVR